MTDRKTDFPEWLSYCAIFAAIVGLAAAIPQKDFSRNGLVAISELCMIILGSIILRRIFLDLSDVFPFLKRDPEKQLIKKQQKAQKLEQKAHRSIITPEIIPANKEIASKGEKESNSFSPPPLPKKELTIDPDMLDKKIEPQFEIIKKN